MLRRQLAKQGLFKAARVRRAERVRSDAPVCVYDLAEQMGVEVWFDALPSLEGMYSKTPRPVIVLSSLRPLGRQTYTSGHELGHHVFSHGFRIDQYLPGGPMAQNEDDEFLVDCF